MRNMIELMKVIKDTVRNAVTKNAKEVKAEMQRILDAAAAAAPAPEPALEQQQGITPENLRQILESLNLNQASGGPHVPLQPPHQVNPNQAIACDTGLLTKLNLRKRHIMEDAEDFNRILLGVKLATDLTDSEVRYYMKEVRTGTRKLKV